MKQIFSILTILLLLCMSACRQTESLDEPVTLSMKWNGDTSDFQETEEGNMWLSSLEGSGEASVYMPVDGPAAGMKYEFALYTELNPSSSNYARVYVWSREPDTEDPGEAFFIRLGYTKDNVCLCHQVGDKKPKVLITGREGIMNAAFSEVWVQVTVEEDGTFRLFTRMEFEDDYTEEGEYAYSDDLPAEEGYFMLNCKFTKKGSNAFAFEKISVGPLKGGNEPPGEDDGNDDNDDDNDDDNSDDDIVDDDLPEWLDTEVLSPVSFLFLFDRKVDSSGATFTLSGEEAVDQTLSQNKKQVTVTFENAMKEGKEYRLIWKGITSVNGKMEAKGIYRFTYKEPDNDEPDEPGQPSDDKPSVEISAPEQEPGKNSYRIKYKLDEAGYSYTAIVYDAAGNSVDELIGNETLPVSGTLRWDAKRQDGIYLRPGVYIFYIEFYHTNGKVYRFKKRFIVVK